MLQTLALAAALSLAPAQNVPLAITNDRITFGGEFGPPRPHNKLLPGDLFFLAFDIENLKLDPQGKVQYTIGMEVTDSAGKAIYTQKPADQELILPLGGNKLPARAYVTIGLNQAAGMHNCRVTVTDRMTNVTKTLDKQFEILPRAFGIVYVFTSMDEEGAINAPLHGIAGQPFYLHFVVVGFARDAAKQPNLVAEIRVFENGKPTNEQALGYAYNKGVDEKLDGLPYHIPIPKNRAGSFMVEVKADCKLSGQSYKIGFPITVTPAAK